MRLVEFLRRLYNRWLGRLFRTYIVRNVDNRNVFLGYQVCRLCPGSPAPATPYDEVMTVRSSGPVHEAFGLTYASYLVVPRVLLAEMPLEWQKRFVEMMDQFHAEYPNWNDDYSVHLVDENGTEIAVDPLSSYRHPNWTAVYAARGLTEES